MNAGRLLEHFERISETPEAIARLRQLLLDLALRGKLVEPAEADEPASHLKARLDQDVDSRRRAGDYTEPRNVVEISIDSLPFHVPATWEWARLIEIADVSYGYAFESARFNAEKRGMPLVRIRDLSKADTEAYFDGDFDPHYVVNTGDYLVGMDGDFNLRKWAGPSALLNQRVMRLRGWRLELVAGFLAIPLQQILRHIHDSTSLTTVKHLSAKQVNGIYLPIPPVAEQHRIVAKVDELMALCDRLEAAQAERESRRDRLVSASLQRLSQPAADPTAFRDHARFHLDHLPRLATRIEHVQQLRYAIRNLGAQGRLVSQDSRDEPVSELLMRIEQPPKPPRYAKRSPELIVGSCALSIGDPGTPVPSGWKRVPLVEIARLESGHTPSRNRSDWWGGEIRWIGLVDARIHDGGTIHETIQRTNEKGIENSAARVLPAGTVCFSRTASVGYVVIMGRPMATSQDFVNWVPTAAVEPRWLQLVLIAEKPAMTRFSKGAIHQTVYYPAWLSMHVCLPPLAEQRRIVAKVDELMPVCDQLEAAIATAQSERRRLLEALLHEALQPAA